MVITALNKILNSTIFIANDFNFIYLNVVLEKYKANDLRKNFLYFKIAISIDERNYSDIVNNFVQFIKRRYGIVMFQPIYSYSGYLKLNILYFFINYVFLKNSSISTSKTAEILYKCSRLKCFFSANNSALPIKVAF